MSQWGSQGTGAGEFNLPWGLGLDAEDNVYVADWRNDRVQKFDSNGHYLKTIGDSEVEEEHLARPSAVSIDKMRACAYGLRNIFP